MSETTKNFSSIMDALVENGYTLQDLLEATEDRPLVLSGGTMLWIPTGDCVPHTPYIQ